MRPCQRSWHDPDAGSSRDDRRSTHHAAPRRRRASARVRELLIDVHVRGMPSPVRLPIRGAPPGRGAAGRVPFGLTHDCLGPLPLGRRTRRGPGWSGHASGRRCPYPSDDPRAALRPRAAGCTCFNWGVRPLMTEETARAPGAPGAPPTWSSSEKDAVGTSHFSSRVWFTIGHGILNEVYWPRVDRPQVRDLGLIVADDDGFWSEVKRDASRDVRHLEPGVPAIIVTHSHPRYTLTLRICADDHADVIHVEARLEDPRDVSDSGRLEHPLRLYPLLAPHLGFSGLHNSAWTGTYKGRAMLFAQTGGAALALASDPGPVRQSVGYVGASDGWQDFATNGRMAWTYGITEAGNVAGMTELVLADGVARLALGFGTRPEEAGLEACAALAGHFENAWDEYVGNWHGFLRTVSSAAADVSEEYRALYLTSAAVLRTHADRTVPGAIVASLSIPWGNTRNDPVS